MATIGIGGVDSNPYARLGLAPGASIADVKRAYRRLAMHFHPDHAGPGSLQTFMAVKAAYEWIVAHHSVAGPGRTVAPARCPRPTARTARPARPTDGAATGTRPGRPEQLVGRPLVLGGDPRPRRSAVISGVNLVS